MASAKSDKPEASLAIEGTLPEHEAKLLPPEYEVKLRSMLRQKGLRKTL